MNMKNKLIFILALAISIILFIILFYSTLNTKEPIGGQRDAYGCLSPAGYTYNETFELCVREWELDQTKIEVIQASSDYIEKEYGLTIVSIEMDNLSGIFTIWFDVLGRKKSSNYFPEKIYCGEDRGDYCIQVWEPVCGFGDFGSKTYSNGCVACLNASVEYYINIECL